MPGLFSVDLLGAAPASPQGTGAPQASTNAALRLLASAAAQRTALVCGDAALSYGALRQRVARTAGLLRARGIAIKLPDGIDWVTAFLGAMWAGAVAVPVNPRVPAAEWQYILDEAGFSVILVDADDDTPPGRHDPR